MAIDERVKGNLRRMQAELGDQYWRTSAVELTLLPAIEAALDRHAEGSLLDAGAGRQQLYKQILEPFCAEYESLDVKGGRDIDHRQDLQDTDLPSNRYDTVFCRNVLEHVPYPEEAMSEIQRVLRPGGRAIVTVPHLAYLHNEPHDYFRFTAHGLRRLTADVGLDELHIEPVGGLFGFLGYSFATLLLGTTYDLPLVGAVALRTNARLQELLVGLDDLTGNERYFPLNYLLIAAKPDTR